MNTATHCFRDDQVCSRLSPWKLFTGCSEYGGHTGTKSRGREFIGKLCDAHTVYSLYSHVVNKWSLFGEYFDIVVLSLAGLYLLGGLCLKVVCNTGLTIFI